MPTVPGSTRTLAAAVAVALLAAACGGDDDDAAPTSTAPVEATTTAAPTTEAPTTTSTAPTTTAVPSGDAFYEPPADVPAEAGVLIRAEQDDRLAADGASAYRILYTSTDQQGGVVVTSGTVVVPDGGGSPPAVLAWGHGTVGLGDRCAPSRGGGGEGPEPEEDWPDEVIPTELTPDALSRGWVVAAADYQGLGTPGNHTFLVGQPSGRAVLDAARAATQLEASGAGPDTPVVVMGESQGGHAALFAGQEAATYAPDVPVVGVVGFAPLVEIATILPLAGAALPHYLMMGTSGFTSAYPDLDPAVPLSPAFVEQLPAVADMCWQDAFDAFGTAQGVVGGDPATDPGWSAALEANTPGVVASAAPVLVLHGEADTTIPAVLSQSYAERACAAGTEVERSTYPGAGHGRGNAAQPGVLDAGAADAFTWAEARIAGTPLTAPCPPAG